MEADSKSVPYKTMELDERINRFKRTFLNWQCTVCLLLMFYLALDIAAISVGFKYQHTPCAHFNLWLIDPVLFLKVAGFSQFGLILFIFTSICCLTIIGRRDDQQSKKTQKGYVLIVALSGIFVLSWSITGLDVYNRMSDDCQTSHLGRMVLAWSVLKLLVVVSFTIAGARSRSRTRQQQRSMPIPDREH